MMTMSFCASRPSVIGAEFWSSSSSRAPWVSLRPTGRIAGRVDIVVSSSSESCQISSNVWMSFCLPRTVWASWSRVRARSAGESTSTVSAEMSVCPALASEVSRAATLTASPKTSVLSSITGPKWKPAWIASGAPLLVRSAEICVCMAIAA